MGRGRIGRRVALAATLVLACATVGALVSGGSAGAIGFVDQWGKTGGGPGQFGFPVSVAVDPGGTVYVADSENDRVQKFDQTGTYLGEWGTSGSGPGEFATPEAVAVDGSGGVYVADKGNYRIQKFTADGTFVSQWGGEGAGPGQFEEPEGLAIDSGGDVYVADAGNDRIAKFSPAGTPIVDWGTTGRAPGQFNAPDGVAVDATGNVYVTDSGNDRIQKFTSSGAFLTKWGKTGDGPGEFDFPAAVGTDAGGRVYVADVVNDRIEVFDGNGKFRSQWGAPGSAPGQFESPIAVTPSATGRVFVADGGNNRIQVFGKLPKPRYGKAVNVGVVSGIVRIRLPGSRKFILLGTEQQLPVGTIIDAGRGRVRLSSAKGPGGGTQTADFYAAAFRVLQPKGGRPLTVLKLKTSLACGKTKHLRSSRRSKNRGLWGSGKGNFRSEGRHGSATVRGTIWWTADTCRGTLFKVKRGVVTIRDFSKHRKLKLRRGQRYLAPNG